MKKLNNFSQEDIDKAIESFDSSYVILEVIYKNILDFSSNKNIEIKKGSVAIKSYKLLKLSKTTSTFSLG